MLAGMPPIAATTVRRNTMDERIKFVVDKSRRAIVDTEPDCKGKSVADVLIKACAMISSCEPQIRDDNKDMSKLIKDLEMRRGKDTFEYCNALSKLVVSSKVYLATAFNAEFIVNEKDKENKDDPMFG